MSRKGSIRLGSGHLKGKSVQVLEGLAVRPMRTRVREALFNRLQNQILSARVLDVFAGSGALGIEAISRGARQSILIEKNKDVLEILKANLQKLGVEAQCKIMVKDAYRLRPNPPSSGFDVILLDPPFPDYSGPQSKPWTLATQLASGAWLNAGGLLIMEYPSREEIAAPPPGLEAQEGRRYGDTSLIFWSKAKSSS
ncbi:MAG TPA: 16S rRNA (guanine(966)-N(2))-methyltransferase RsmD [Planctomycetes bacterium]|nr:16S rRNA (guanine(966)-N(2))-methyltransferase RsmD [Planctomycetota bacterium]